MSAITEHDVDRFYEALTDHTPGVYFPPFRPAVRAALEEFAREALGPNGAEQTIEVLADPRAHENARQGRAEGAPAPPGMRLDARSHERTLDAKASMAGSAQGAELSRAEADVFAERRRQIDVEGWTPEHDDGHDKGEIARAAVCYTLGAISSELNDLTEALKYWPWDRSWWKVSSGRRDLIKAGALILAEIERLDRSAGSRRLMREPSRGRA